MNSSNYNLDIRYLELDEAIDSFLGSSYAYAALECIEQDDEAGYEAYFERFLDEQAIIIVDEDGNIADDFDVIAESIETQEQRDRNLDERLYELISEDNIRIDIKLRFASNVVIIAHVNQPFYNQLTGRTDRMLLPPGYRIPVEHITMIEDDIVYFIHDNKEFATMSYCMRAE